MAVANRIREQRLTAAKLARVAGVDPRTVRLLIDGRRWPTQATRDALCDALGWPRGEITRRSDGRPELHEYTLAELLHEVSRRVSDGVIDHL